jgi:hypothetical protein
LQHPTFERARRVRVLVNGTAWLYRGRQLLSIPTDRIPSCIVLRRVSLSLSRKRPQIPIRTR